jgi:heme/copper-type cytochrome/quinol oxidase subunit 2
MTARSLLFWISAACCVVAEAAILRSLLFGRAREQEQQRAVGGGTVVRSARPVEIAWAILPAVGLALVLYLTWRAVEVPSVSNTPDANRIGASIGE